MHTCAPSGPIGLVRGLTKPLNDAEDLVKPQRVTAISSRGRLSARPPVHEAASPRGRLSVRLLSARPPVREAAVREAASPRGRLSARPPLREAACPRGRLSARPPVREAAVREAACPRGCCQRGRLSARPPIREVAVREAACPRGRLSARLLSARPLVREAAVLRSALERCRACAGRRSARTGWSRSPRRGGAQLVLVGRAAVSSYWGAALLGSRLPSPAPPAVAASSTRASRLNRRSPRTVPSRTRTTPRAGRPP
jgi:hypothetical protein